MQLPFFYIPDYDPANTTVVLPEETSRHVIQVLRMKEGEKLNLTDGRGNLLTAKIAEAHKKNCTVQVTGTAFHQQPGKKISIAISLLKNPNRFEWFLEKATELGINEIIPLICERTEKEKFRMDRMQQICISAMLQSQQYQLPLLQEPVAFEKFMLEQNAYQQKFIAHCAADSGRKELTSYTPFAKALIVIGPEGDFSKKEIDLALQSGYLPVSLGNTRLRTETAGVTAAVLLLSK